MGSGQVIVSMQEFRYQVNVHSGDTTSVEHFLYEKMLPGGPPFVAWRFRRPAAVSSCNIFRPEGLSGPLAGVRRGPWGSAEGQSRRGHPIACKAPSKNCLVLFVRKNDVRKNIFGQHFFLMSLFFYEPGRLHSCSPTHSPFAFLHASIRVQ